MTDSRATLLPKACDVGIVCCLFVALLVCNPAKGADPTALEHFQNQIQPILEEKCYDCHGYGMEEGSVAFDGFESDERSSLSRNCGTGHFACCVRD